MTRAWAVVVWMSVVAAGCVADEAEPVASVEAAIACPPASAPAWTAGQVYPQGTLASEGGVVYQCLQTHTSQATWTPGAAAALWARPTPCGVSEWAPQTIYALGSQVRFGGASYECLQAHTSVVTWTPAAAPALWGGVAVDHPPVVDQLFDPPTDLGNDINEGVRYAGQTYTAGVTGTLMGVSVNVFGSGTHPLRVSIRSVSGGVPTDVVLGSAQTASNGALFTTTIEFAEAIPQVAGQPYAIVLDYPTAPPHGAGMSQGVWQGSTGNRYAAGALVSSEDGHTWRSFAAEGYDVKFRTVVKPQ